MRRSVGGRRAGGTAAALLCAASIALHAQIAPPNAPSPQSPVFRSDVDVIVVEAQVVDKGGATAKGLTPADFQVTIGGRQREVVSAELAEYENAPAVPRDADISTNIVRGAARTILVAVDQASLRPESRTVLESAKRWIATLGPSDRIGLVSVPGGPRVEFTTEHQRVIDVLGAIALAPTRRPLTATIRNVSLWEGLRISEGDTIVQQMVVQRECRGEPGCLGEIRIAASDIAIDAQYRVDAVLGPLRSLLRALGVLQGPKHMLLLSSGWPIAERAVAVEVASMAAEAALANVTVHSFTAEQWAGAAAASRPSTTPSQDRMLLMTAVEMLSGATGGQAARLNDDGEGAFKTLSAGLTGYYRLGVRAEPDDLDGKARNIGVKVLRPGVSLATHRKVMAGTRAAPGPSTGDPTTALRSAIESAALRTDLDLRCTSYVLHDEHNDRTLLRVMVAGDVARATPGTAAALAVIYDLGGQPVANGGQQVDVQDGAARFQTILKVKPGSYRLRVAVRDANGRIGTVERGIDARWIKAGDAETTGLALYRVPSRPGAPSEPLFGSVATGDRVVAQLALAAPVSQTRTSVVIELAREGQSAPLLTKYARIGATDAGVTLAQETLPPALLTSGRYTLTALVEPGGVKFTRSFVVE